ncbi:MAG: hypothetical protein IKR81_18230 [Victivallales bacterium]|nr:hypothetical protein [Victivallales bacterium]
MKFPLDVRAYHTLRKAEIDFCELLHFVVVLEDTADEQCPFADYLARFPCLLGGGKRVEHVEDIIDEATLFWRDGCKGVGG